MYRVLYIVKVSLLKELDNKMAYIIPSTKHHLILSHDKTIHFEN